MVCFFHFRWEKYFDEYFDAAYNPYSDLTSEIPKQIDNAKEQSNFLVEGVSGRFIAYNNGIIWDKKTSFEWISGPDKDMTWDEAKSWVENLTVDGGGWRIPTIKELKTLYQEGVGPHNMTPLLKTTGGYIWSSEIKEGSSMAHGFLFDNIDEHWGFPSVFDKRAFAVRSRK
jgi:hypothetical protein